ncbi:CHAD domain-containing protein [Cohaesibacter sp. ES.047]|uniref:CHAD domain-containing protein n=1 Tax=Cohaesibacter sp. ES.047 TaxID=1798205 RepID=UPI000BB8DB44|nr:CHAD domain-containing protein [Cohaesibacter sp. ES.047]SNY91265.1 CHAD domain-containing protein [Cohaesibacter sp. ES.047]
MKHAEQLTHYLPTYSADGLTDESFGKLRLTYAPSNDGFSATLLDTFDHALRRSGRLLVAGEGMLELMDRDGSPVRQAARQTGGFVADFDDGAVKEAIADVPALRALLAIGDVDLCAISAALVDDEEKTHVRVQLMQVSTSDGFMGLLVTLRALRGYEKSRSAALDRLAALGGKPLKAADLYTRLFPKRLAYNTKPKIRIGNDEEAFDVATDIIAAHLPVARANEAGIIEDIDTEFLHDYRIALRKTRSVLSLFKGVYDDETTRSLKDRFSTLMAPTGRLRDLDVYLLEKQKFYDLLPQSLHGGLDQMFALFAAERQDVQQTMAGLLSSKAYRREITDLQKLFRKPKRLGRGPKADLHAHSYASKLIWKRYRKICKIAKGIGPETDDREVHELRIHCKKLRYLMEFFAPIFPKAEFKSLIRPLKRLQDNLGSFNDYSVQKETLAAFVEGLNVKQKKQQMEIAQTVGALIAILHRRQLEERAKVVDNFARFNSKETQKTFRHLFNGGESKS